MMKSVIKKSVGFTLAGASYLVVLFSLYQLFTTGDLHWLILTIPSAGFTLAGFVLAYGSFSDFMDTVLSALQMIP